MDKAITLFSILAFTIMLSNTACQPAVGPGYEKDAETTTPLDPESLYQSEGKWENQHGDTLRLSSLSGKIPILTMVFTRCTFACPRIVADMQAIEARLPKDKNDDVVFVLISFDSDRDTTEYLKQFAKKMKLGDKWLVLHGDEQDVREISMLLNVKYKKTLNGDFTHSSGISMLNTGGVLVKQSEGLGKDPQEFINAIQLIN